MKKTSVYLDDGDARRLAWLAKRERTSQAQIVRRAIAAYDPTDRSFALVDSGEGPGGSVADIPEEELLDGFGS